MMFGARCSVYDADLCRWVGGTFVANVDRGGVAVVTARWWGIVALENVRPLHVVSS